MFYDNLSLPDADSHLHTFGMIDFSEYNIVHGINYFFTSNLFNGVSAPGS